MTLPPHGLGATGAALSTLTDEATITRHVLDPNWTPSDGPQAEIVTDVWSGCASLGHGTARLSSGASPAREVGTDRLRVPAECDGGPAAGAVQVGDTVKVASVPDRTWVVASTHDRTTTVLQRITIVDARYADGVPR